MLSSFIDRINENKVWFPLVAFVFLVSFFWVVSCRSKQRQRAMATKVFMPACQKAHSVSRCLELFDLNQEECLFWTYRSGRYSGSSFDAKGFIRCAYGSKAFLEARRKKRESERRRHRAMSRRR